MSEDLNFFISLLINGLVVGSIYSLISLPIVLIYKSSKVFNLAQGELVMVGGYLCLFVIQLTHLNLFLALFVTIIVMSVLGFIIERIVLRPMIGESFIAVIMITLGLASILRGLVSLLWGTEIYVYPKFLQEIEISIMGYHFSGIYLVSLGLCIALLILFFFFFKYSIFGIAIRATASDQVASMSMGISVKRVFGITWAISAAIAATVGTLIGCIRGLNLTISLYGLLALAPVILGGLDSIGGAILASFLVGIMESLAQGYLSSLIGGYVENITAFVIILIILITKPYGLFGVKEIERV
jgi:branched-chain amino acid transport system permease protein